MAVYFWIEFAIIFTAVYFFVLAKEVNETSSNGSVSAIQARLIVSANHIRLPSNNSLNISCDLTDKMAELDATVCTMTIVKMNKSDTLSRQKSSEFKGTQTKDLVEYSAITDQPNTPSNQHSWTGSLTLTLAEVTFDDGGLYGCDVTYIRGRSKDTKEAGQICSENIRNGSKEILFAHAREILEVGQIGELNDATFEPSPEDGENYLQTKGSVRQKSLSERNPLLVTVPVVVALVALSVMGLLWYLVWEKPDVQLKQQTTECDLMGKDNLYSIAYDRTVQGEGDSDNVSGADPRDTAPGMGSFAITGAFHPSVLQKTSHLSFASLLTAASSEKSAFSAEAPQNPMAHKKSHISLLSRSTGSAEDISSISAEAAQNPLTHKQTHISLISSDTADGSEKSANSDST